MFSLTNVRDVLFAVIVSLLNILITGCSNKQEPQGEDIKLPSLQPCANTSIPTLPGKWHAVALLHPFNQSQLGVADIVYDSSVNAMRVSLFGVEKGYADFLITSSSVYLLYPYNNPTLCAGPYSLDGWELPTQQWLANGSSCIGEQTILGTMCEWWKWPSDVYPAANWLWLRSDNQFPWRLMLDTVGTMPIIGDFAMTYFPKFEELQQTNLPQILAMCNSNNSKPDPKIKSVRSISEILLANDRKSNEKERKEISAVIPKLIPGLSFSECAAEDLPQFPDSLMMTVLMTAVNVNFNPFPTVVHYNWAQQSQLTRMFQPDTSVLASVDALLVGGVGYDIDNYKNGNISCAQVLPGPPVTNWMEKDSAKCMAVIKNNPQLSPNRTTLLIVCPLEDTRVFWTWYTDKGTPVMFMETAAPAAEGTGLCLADYYEFRPNYSMNLSIFKVPANCSGDLLPGRPQMHHASVGVDPACYNCHLGSPTP